MQRFMSSVRVMRAVVLIAPLLIVFAAGNTVALSTAFTYQGQLLQSGLPTDGTCDFQFGLFAVDSGGTASGTQTASPVNVINGLFTVQLNNSGQLGANVFNGSDRWLEIAVRCPVGSGSYVTLSPRQQLTATPYALYAPNAGSANGLSCSGCVNSSSIAGGTIQQSNLAFTPGTVTSITAGTGLGGGTITTSGIISNSGVLSVGASAPLASSGGQNPNLSLTGTVPVGNGGTGASTAAAARTSLGAAASGANSDITSLSGITDAHGSTRLGLQALSVGGTGINNTAVGRNALAANTFSGSNTAVGESALAANTSEGGNTAVGANALAANTANNNTAVGQNALGANNRGSFNTAIGSNALGANPNGSSNIAIGKDAGSSTTTGGNDIYVGNTGTNESNTTRIGTAQTRVFIAGISGATSTGGVPVVVNASGQLGTATGAVAAGPRFVDNGDGTVTDNKTGLMWEKKTDDGSVHDKDNTYSWSSTGTAFDGTAKTAFLNVLNDVAHSGARCFAGYCDWRLPNEDGQNPPYTGAKELESILDYTQGYCGGGTGACVYPALAPTVPYGYWSATTHAGSPLGVWLVGFWYGDVYYFNKDVAYYVHAVRSGL